MRCFWLPTELARGGLASFKLVRPWGWWAADESSRRTREWPSKPVARAASLAAALADDWQAGLARRCLKGGGISWETGEVHHPQTGARLKRAWLLLQRGKGAKTCRALLQGLGLAGGANRNWRTPVRSTSKRKRERKRAWLLLPCMGRVLDGKLSGQMGWETRPSSNVHSGYLNGGPEHLNQIMAIIVCVLCVCGLCVCHDSGPVRTGTEYVRVCTPGSPLPLGVERER